MKILQLKGNKTREIEIIAQNLPEMLFQRSRQQFNHSTTHPMQAQSPFNQTNIRPRKGTATTSYNLGYNMNSHYPDMHALQERKKGMEYEPHKSYPVELCIDMEWGKTARDYCQRTTLHGLRYLGDEELHVVERLFWTVAFILGVLAAAYFITVLYKRWDDNPMIISLSPTATLLQSIPFPAITICNMNGAKKSIADGIVSDPNNDPPSKFEKEMLVDLCDKRDTEALAYNDRVDANWSTIQKFFIKVSQPCHEMLVSCKWRDDAVSCNDIFNPELTDEGMCCSFNKVERSFIYKNPRQLHGLNYTFPWPGIDWTPEKGYPPNTPPNANPWRAFGAGKAMGLTVILDAELHDYYCSSTASVGFKLLLHNPIETPKISEFAYLLTPGLETRVEIVPKISTSTVNLVNIPENKRQCVFPSDRDLRFYRTYTQRNCELECQSNFTLSRCKCVPFYLPKDVTTRICGTGDDECVYKAKVFMEFRIKDEKSNITDWDVQDVSCSCPPSCVQIRYGKQMSSSKLDDIFKIKADYLNGRDPAYYKKNMAVVHFYFIDNSFMGFEKGEIFGFTDFLSSTGGLLGLFLGFSFMSAAEVVYFTTLRLLCSWTRKHRQRRRQIDCNLPFAE